MTDELMPLREALQIALNLIFAREKVLVTKVKYGDPVTDKSVITDRAEYENLIRATATLEAFARTKSAEVDPRQGKML
jgi:hypothetical protein